MKENSIEEDIKIVENYLANSAINKIDSNFFKNGGWETVDLEIPESMQHILSDYKRVLEINEVLLKENEELKADNYELNNRITDLLENIPIQTIEDKIEDLKMSGGSDGKDNTENTARELAIEALQDILDESKGK